MALDVYVVDKQNAAHKITGVTDIALDNTSFAGILDGSYRNEGPSLLISSEAGSGGIPSPGTADVGGKSPTAVTFKSSGTLPSAITSSGLLILPDPMSGVPPYPQINPQSIIKFTVATTFAGVGLFWFVSEMKGIKTDL